MNTDLHFSSKSDEWETPRELFELLDNEFNFGLDVCANVKNSKCVHFIDKKTDGLKVDWIERREIIKKYLFYRNTDTYDGTFWINPPYSESAKWIKKASNEAQKGATVVCLLPARTDTKAFHKYIWDLYEHKPRPGVEVRFLKGRLKFVGAEHSAPFPSMIVIFRGS